MEVRPQLPTLRDSGATPPPGAPPSPAASALRPEPSSPHREARPARREGERGPAAEFWVSLLISQRAVLNTFLGEIGFEEFPLWLSG